MSDQPIPIKETKGRGCFFYGCLTSIVLVLVAALGVFFGIRYGLNKLNALIAEYTDTQPLALPKVEISDAERAALDTRLATFYQALEARTATAPLTLTANEINALIASNPSLRPWKDKLYVTLDGDQIKAQVSLPLTDMARVPGFSALKGRYLNGEARLHGALEDGKLMVRMQSLEIKGRSLPAQLMTQLQKENLADQAHRDPKNADVLGKLESIEVKDGQFIIKAKQ
jgi:hypothetical protein